MALLGLTGIGSVLGELRGGNLQILMAAPDDLPKVAALRDDPLVAGMAGLEAGRGALDGPHDFVSVGEGRPEPLGLEAEEDVGAMNEAFRDDVDKDDDRHNNDSPGHDEGDDDAPGSDDHHGGRDDGDDD